MKFKTYYVGLFSIYSLFVWLVFHQRVKNIEQSDTITEKNKIKIKNKIKNRPTDPIFFGDETLNRHIILFGLR